MAGEAAEFDVFISYRVSSDLKHAERLYNLLIAAGLRVWWDKKCLESGKEWQKGFCRGLGSSTAFLCILSKAGTEEPFESLHAESRCDNVLLEHRLALAMLVIWAPFIIFDGVQVVLVYALRSLGDQVIAGINSIIAYFLVTGGLGLVLVQGGWGPTGLVLASGIGMVAAALLHAVRFYAISRRVRVQK